MRLAALVTAAALSGLVHAKNFTQGFDISSADSEVDFEGAYESGARFVSIRVRVGPSPPRPEHTADMTNIG